MSSQADFQSMMETLAADVGGRTLDAGLAQYLNDTYPVDGPYFRALSQACTNGIAEGWLCAREAGGIHFGRAIKPGPATQGFSVDVVRMKDVKGPHHGHPKGEICAVMPLTPSACFDGHAAGWCVYEPGSGHHPTVSDGEAVVLYLLPDGAIEFTR